MVELDDTIAFEPPAVDIPPPAGDGWQTASNGRRYVKAVGRQGTVFQKGDETVDEALARDAARGNGKPADKRPGSGRKKAPPKPPPPRQVDLKEIERELVEALSSPAMICATFGDAWAADHFTRQAPVLARNLVVAAERNPWLRRKLEQAATGGDVMMRLLALLGVGGAIVGYAVPPLIYWLNLPVPEQARLMFGIPPRREDEDGAPPAAHAFPAAA